MTFFEQVISAKNKVLFYIKQFRNVYITYNNKKYIFYI